MSQKNIDRIIFITLFLALLALLGLGVLRRAGDIAREEAEDGTPRDNTICGLEVLTDEECAVLSKEKTVIQHPARLGDVLLFNGEPVACDERTNTCYISQPAGEDSFAGVFQTTHADTSAYWLLTSEEAAEAEGGAVPLAKESLLTGSLHRIWISAPDTCATVNVAFTTLPVLNFITASGLKPEYTEAELFIQDGGSADNEGLSLFSLAQAKESSSGETITFKLRNAGYTGKNRLSLAGLGDYDTWKAYAVDPEKPFHMMLAFQFWNACSAESGTVLPCRYIELVADGVYRGLYILRPRVDDDAFRKLNKLVEVLDTDDLPAEAVPHDLYRNYSPENLSDLGLYFEATYALANLYDDTKVLQDSDGKYYIIPGKPEYVFGDFPKRYNYYAYRFEDRMLRAADFGLDGAAAQAFDQTLFENWVKAREAFLSDDALAEALDILAEELTASGYAARNEFFLTSEEWESLQENEVAPRSPDLLAEEKQMLLDGLIARYTQLDEKMGG